MFDWSRKNICLWKTYMIVEKYFLYKNWLISKKIFACRKLLWLWKTSLIVKKFLDCGKTFACGKIPWLWKYLCLWENFLIIENFLECRIVLWPWKTSLIVKKLSWSSLLKMKYKGVLRTLASIEDGELCNNS